MSMLFKRIKDWAVSITSFRTGDVIPVDGPSGTAKMPYSDLSKEVIKDSANNTAATEADLVAGSKVPIMTANGPKSLPGNTIAKASEQAALTTYAQNVAHSIAPDFDPTRTSENPYKAGETVMYTDGKAYTFKVDHYGAWSAADVFSQPVVKSYENKIQNLHNDLTIEDVVPTVNGYFSAGGSFVENSQNDATGLIDLRDFSSICVFGQNTDKKLCLCLDSAKNILGFSNYSADYLNGVDLFNVTLRSGTRYVRMFGWNNSHSPAPSIPFRVVVRKNNVARKVDNLKNTGFILKMDDIAFTDGYSVNNTNGQINSSNSFACSEKIFCEGIVSLRVSMPKIDVSISQQGLAFYDVDGVFISGVVLFGSQSVRGVDEKTIPVPSNAVYFRTTFWNSTNRTTYSYEFTCFGIGKYTEDLFKKSSVVDTGVPQIYDGFAISVYTGDTYTSANMGVTDYVNCSSVSKIIISVPYHSVSISVEGLVFYDDQKQKISGVVFKGSQASDGVEIMDIPVPSNAVYFRTTFWNSTNRTTYSYEFTCKLIYDVFDLKYFETGNGGVKNPSVIYGSPTPYIPEIPNDALIDGLTSTELYAELDGYASLYSDIFKRQTDIGVDSDNNPIRHYILGYNVTYVTGETSLVNTLWDGSKNPPHIVIISGVHGDEKTASYGTLKFFEQLLNSNEPWAEFIKTNFILHYVPIVNVWGFDNFSRENKDEINVNRDFGIFETSEARSVRDLVESIGDKLILGIDSHSNRWYGYIGVHRSLPHYDLMAKTAYRISASMRNMLTSLYSDASKSPYFALVDVSASNTFNKWMLEQGYIGALVETPRNTAMNGSRNNQMNVTCITSAALAGVIQMLGMYGSK